MSDSDFAWATVYSENPVTVRRDGETEPIGVTPQTVVPLAMLSVKDRVWCQFVNRRALILGKANGAWPTFAQGAVSLPGGSGEITNVSITFPAGRFSETPSVFVNPNTGVIGSTFKGAAAGNINRTGFTLYGLRTNSTGTGVNWTAIGV